MDKLDIGYGFQRTIDQTPGSNNLNIAGNLQITGHWQVRASHERNLETQTVIKTGLGFNYISQCWSLKVDYTEESDDRGVSATVNLTGLGGWGN